MMTIDEERQKIVNMTLKLYELVDGLFQDVESYRGEESYRRAGDVAKLAEEYKDILMRQATLFIARFQPLASDLIFAESALSISYDLYRIARYLREITIMMKSIGGELIVEKDAMEALLLSRRMLNQAVKIFATGDLRTLEEVLKSDDMIDEVYRKYLNKLGSSKEVSVSVAATLLFMRHVERIADHATYIAKAAERTWS
ncbi:MAG: phosphate uptake regulator PhoU [Acidilobaceae archaeon]|nr:phosphate uptake regulator PhoU [Acidilobaceae archaeon]MCX8165624.1 phosphate uptake regulator PhoU [Acidilobaceae archaeon]